MDHGAILALVAATAVLVCIPGPNVALFIANTLVHGMRHGSATVLGTTLGVAVQLAIVVLGFAVVLEFTAAALSWLKWAGVIYLLFLGVRSWREKAEDVSGIPASRASIGRVFWQGMALAVINPKTLLFAAAFLPQFVPADAHTPFALLTPALIYLAVIFLGDLCWVLSAHVARPALRRVGRLRHRLTGSLFIGAGIGLAAARIDT